MGLMQTVQNKLSGWLPGQETRSPAGKDTTDRASSNNQPFGFPDGTNPMEAFAINEVIRTGRPVLVTRDSSGKFVSEATASLLAETKFSTAQWFKNSMQSKIWHLVSNTGGYSLCGPVYTSEKTVWTFSVSPEEGTQCKTCLKINAKV